tara:strand:+ start:4822 stop:5715 length:894 start_codon:yes stop_codon:yes gene_type:complete
VRLHKRLRMTPAADYLVQVAERILVDLERADLDLQVMADASRHTMHHLLNRHIDLAVLPGEAAMAGGTVALPLFTEESFFIIPPGHRHADHDFIEAADLKGEDHITTQLAPAPDMEFARLMRPAESYPQWTTPAELPEAIMELVAAGLGTSMLAHWAVARAVREGRLAMATVLAAAGYDVTRFDINPGALVALEQAGGHAAADTEAAAMQAYTIITMLPEGDHVRTVLNSALLAVLPRNRLLIDCSTIAVTTAQELAALVSDHGHGFVDAPVSGGAGDGCPVGRVRPSWLQQIRRSR